MPAAVVESYDYTQLIGCDFTVTDADNSTFAVYLPRTGTAVRQIAVQDWGKDWLVLQLHDAFEYQLGSIGHRFSGCRHHAPYRSFPLDWTPHWPAAHFRLRSSRSRSLTGFEPAVSQRRFHSHHLGYDSAMLTCSLQMPNQLLAAVKSRFDFMKQSPVFPTLAAAGGGLSPSHWVMRSTAPLEAWM